ncbi:MAG TPA: acetylglutamate kinase [Candidatus Angelobacter sp.]|nr:acetylglutamate kinase [Candidatus Angelobacter sp.]
MSQRSVQWSKLSISLISIPSSASVVKIVIQTASNKVDDNGCARMLAEAVAQLCHDGHQVTILHSSAGNENTAAAPSNDGVLGEPLNDIEAALMAVENRQLAACLDFLGIPGIGLCGSDLGIFHLRKRDDHKRRGRAVVEVSSMNSRWLGIICGNGGVPVISTLCLGAWGKYYLLPSGQAASMCATSWNADALIFLTEDDGVIDRDGTVMRWLEINQIDQLTKDRNQNDAMLVRLRACRQALKHGVHRVRILPIARAELLSLFYWTKIEFGTEVIMAATE